MAFTILPDGSIKADSADDLRIALAIVREQRETEQQPKPTPPRAEAKKEARVVRMQPAPTLPIGLEAGYRALYEQMSDQPKQQALLRAVLSSARDLSDAELRHMLGLGSNLDLRGLLIGLVRRAANRKLPNPVVKQMTRTDGGRRRVYRYGADSAFRAAMDGYDFKESEAV